MKRTIVILVLSGLISFSAQAQADIGESLFDHLSEKALILSTDGLIKDPQKTSEFAASFDGKSGVYKKNFNVEVKSFMDYEIGEIQTKSGSYPVMFIKRKGNEGGPKIEFLVIYKKNNPEDATAVLDSRRAEWMELCNAHKAGDLVKQLYAADAYYYNRGRLLVGTQAISAEYTYMNNPGYSLKLTPKHVEFVTPDIAYEIGQCSESYNLPYMLLWEKQEDGTWQILMDSNY